MPFGPPQLPPGPPAVVEPAEPARDRATKGGLELSWAAPKGCGSAAELGEQVEHYLAESGEHALSIDATAEQREQSWHLSLSLARPGQTTVREGWKDTPDWVMFSDGERVLSKTIVDYEESDPDFVSLDDAAALVRGLDWSPAQRLFESLMSRS